MQDYTEVPSEITELILALVFESYVVEDKQIQDKIIQNWSKKSALSGSSAPKLESVFKRQAEIYKFTHNFCLVCKPYWNLMQKSNKIWGHIFSLTVGARSWLSKAPYIFQNKFNCNYRQMCKFLMTFGDQLTEPKFARLDLGMQVKKIGPTCFICSKDKKLWRYDYSNGDITQLNSITEELDGPVVLSKFAVIYDYQIGEPAMSMKIYDCDKNKLIQRYDNILNMYTEHGHVARWTTRRAGDWIELTADVGSMRSEALLHVLARISQHEVIEVPKGERHRLMTIKESGKSYQTSSKDKKMTETSYRVQIRKISNNRIFASSKERHPLTNEVLSTLPFDNCILLGNYAITKRSNVFEVVSTSISPGRRIGGYDQLYLPSFHIRGDRIFALSGDEKVFVHVLD